MSWPRVFHQRPRPVVHEDGDPAAPQQADALGDRVGRAGVAYDVAFDFMLGGVALGPLPPRR